VIPNSSRCHNWAAVSWLICGAAFAREADKTSKLQITIRTARKDFRVIEASYTLTGRQFNRIPRLLPVLRRTEKGLRACSGG
jgi:hypothetical protein